MFENEKTLVPIKEPERQYYFINEAKKHIYTLEHALGRPLKVFNLVVGCQMNAKDSEKLLGILTQIGYEETTKEEEADLIVYNTCTVRENANQKVFGRLGFLNSLKRKNPNLMIALCGCMMQEEAVVEKIKKSYRFVDIIFGTHNIFKIAELLFERFTTKKMVIDIWKDTKQIVEELPAKRKYHFKSGVNIMFGCNNFCSYCIVPYVRGRERSREKEDILKEIHKLVGEGVVEIMLLGQNVNSYGKNLSTPITFAQLLEEIVQIEGIKRVRFMTSHPKDLSDELIEVMKRSPKICRHLHLPLQSGSSSMLEKMNRRYTKEDFILLAQKIKDAIPEISLTTDIIVGFPGETDEDFLETIDVVKKVRFDSAFTFIYSKRTGTPAAIMEEQVPSEIVHKRFDQLLDTISELSKKRCDDFVKGIAEVLVEGTSEFDETLLSGRLSNNMLVHFKGEPSLIGTFQSVSLDELKGFYYYGTLVNNG